MVPNVPSGTSHFVPVVRSIAIQRPNGGGEARRASRSEHELPSHDVPASVYCAPGPASRPRQTLFGRTSHAV
jgi:hypothetical protein